MLDSKTVRDLMVPVIHPLTSDTLLAQAVDLILSSGFSGLPVVDDKHKVIGFLSEHDCLHCLMTSSYYCDNTVVVDGIMTRDPECVGEDESALMLAERMDKAHPKVFPVVDEDKRLLGSISRRHLMIELNRLLKSCRVRL